MGELGALFNPGMRHELEERRARAARREEEGNARDGDLRIDLDSGVAVISAPEDDESEGLAGDAQERATDARSNVSDDESGPAAVDNDEPADRPADQQPAGQPADQPVEQSLDQSFAGRASALTEPNDAPAAPLRPRGKRAMSAPKR